VSEIGEQLKAWDKAGVKWIRFELPDMHGLSRSKTVPIEHAADYAERGLNLYGGASVLDTADDIVSGTLYNEEVKYADQLLHPDPETGAILPWVDRTARFICDASWYDGKPLEATPRIVFRRALEKAHSMGFYPVIGSEFEFFLLDPATQEPLFPNHHIFNPVRNDWVPTIGRILEEMPQIGVSIITSNSEYAASQWEINFAPGVGIGGPDTAFTFKNGVKEIAKQDGLVASFMSKPFAGSAGSGCHTHMSLVNRESGDNVFGEEGGDQGLSELGRWFVGGLIRYARAIDALTVPTVNCFRRRRTHTFSPTNVSWGLEDRTALIRVKGGAVGSRHIEHRAPTAMSNPYLVSAAILSAGLKGIEDRLDPGPAAKPDVPAEEDPSFEPLAASLPEALDDLEAEPECKAFFSAEFVTAFTVMRRYELSRFNDWVTDWERNEYLEFF
jgi:glutamine synthetase